MSQIPPARLSIIIPVGPGDRAWTQLLSQLGALPPDAQLRLVASDATDVDERHLAAVSELPNDRAWLMAPRGRGKQLNAAARVATGELLWFLHADTVFLDVAASVRAVARVHQAEPNALGYFDLQFAKDGPRWMSINRLGVWIRCRLFGLPFGDQGFFIARRGLMQLGGFDESLNSGEDHELVWAAKRAGFPVCCAGIALKTSARRYADLGWLQTTIKHLTLTWNQARRFARGEARSAWTDQVSCSLISKGSQS